MVGKIIGTGSYVPNHPVTNDDLAKTVDTSDEWIYERTGIRNRYIAKEDDVISMSIGAAKNALVSSGLSPKAIDLLLVSTCTSGIAIPSVSCEVQAALDLEEATCFDLNGACAGFFFALNTAQSYIASGTYKRVMVIGSEKLSNIIDWKDRSTCILFGDGAGAVILEATEGNYYPPYTKSIGTKKEAIILGDSLYQEGLTNIVHMNGQDVFKFAVSKVPKAIESVLAKTPYEVKDVQYFILHQANIRIVESIAKRLGLTMEQFPMNLDKYGNTSSASIPVLLDELVKKDTFKAGDKIVIAGFGAGLSWGATLLEWK